MRNAPNVDIQNVGECMSSKAARRRAAFLEREQRREQARKAAVRTFKERMKAWALRMLMEKFF